MKYALLLLFFAVACASSETELAYDAYGEAFDTMAAVPVEAVIAERETYLDGHVTVEGTVHAVCQMKGCWLMLRSHDGEDLRVDVARTEEGEYAFTVPLDISGRRAVARGWLSDGSLTEAHAHHMAQEGGSATRLALSADGVMVASG